VNWQLFFEFLLVTIVLIVTPGPIVTLLISTGATRGVRAAMVTVAGTSIGNAVLLVCIAFGLGWVLRHAVFLFELLRWIGVGYLIFLSFRAWRGAGRPQPVHSEQVHFWRGLSVALSNPKTIVFFTASLPQFVDPSRPVALQLTVMCATTVVLSALSYSCWAVGAGLGHAWFARPARARLLGRLSGATWIGGGIFLSLARRPT
jgi:homoserine/homoserine lactone efflux protein